MTQWGQLTPAWEVIGWAMIGIGAFILLIAWVERATTCRIVLDGSTLYLSEMGSIVAIPADQIQQIGIGQRIGRITAPSDRRPFRREQWVLRLMLPDGQLGVFRHWSYAELRWLSTVLHQLLPLAVISPPVTTLPSTVDAGMISRFGRKLTFVVLAVVMGWMGWVYIRQFQPGMASCDWPSVQGRVIHRRYPADKDQENPEVRYTYTIEGRTHTGDRVAYGYFEADAMYRTALDPLHDDSPLTVFYDPVHPDRSVLLPGVHWNVCLICVGMGCFALILVAGSQLPCMSTVQESLMKRYVVFKLPRSGDQSRGSTGSLSNASTPNVHS